MCIYDDFKVIRILCIYDDFKVIRIFNSSFYNIFVKLHANVMAKNRSKKEWTLGYFNQFIKLPVVRYR